MQPVDRLAIAAPPGGPAVAPATLAVLGALARLGRRTQHYASRACLDDNDQVVQATGLPGRHLDPWLMSPELIRRVFLRSARNRDVALIEGTWEPDPTGPVEFDRPGCLGPAVQVLNLARVALVPCQGLTVGHWPRFPEGIDAIILDGLERSDDFPGWRDAIETLARKPVLGAVEALPRAREALDRPDEAARAIDSLARSFLDHANWSLFHELARRGPIPGPVDDSDDDDDFRLSRRFRVAYAQDEAFTRYFPDTLETLEALGAELLDFSPIHDERLPDRCDLVILGSGYTERHAEALGSNHSLIGALRSFVCQGRRLFAEGGGMAYLGQEIEVDGVSHPTAGLFPFRSVAVSERPRPAAVERTLSRTSWLGPRDATVRGYLGGRWDLRAIPGSPPGCPSRIGPLTAQGDIYFRNQAIGSLIHLHLASRPSFVASLARQPETSHRRQAD